MSVLCANTKILNILEFRFHQRGIFASIFFVKKNEDIQINIKYFKIYLYNIKYIMELKIYIE